MSTWFMNAPKKGWTANCGELDIVSRAGETIQSEKANSLLFWQQSSLLLKRVGEVTLRAAAAAL